MITTYLPSHGGLQTIPAEDVLPRFGEALWIDMFDPSPAERLQVNTALGMELPTREDMEEIEASSRLYIEDSGLFMTALVLANSGTEKPVAGVVTFVLVKGKLITLRYTDPQPFRTFIARSRRNILGGEKAGYVLAALLDTIIDRLADILERVSSEIEIISQRIFDPDGDERPITSADFQRVLRSLGRRQDLSGKIRDSLLSIGRMLAFLQSGLDRKENKDVLVHVKTMMRDVQSLQDHSSYLATKLSYLQDATLGLINIDQNNIIKIMSVAAMVFMPPTLFASIWGMNFHHMPELDQWWAYPISLLIMMISAITPYLWFKRRGWL